MLNKYKKCYNEKIFYDYFMLKIQLLQRDLGGTYGISGEKFKGFGDT